MEDRAKAMYEQLEHNIARSVVEMTWAIKGMEEAAKDGYSPSDAVDVRCTIECLMEDLEEYSEKIREASRYLENKEYEDTDRREFKYERVQQFTDMVHRL